MDPLYLRSREFSDLEDELMMFDLQFLKKQREPLFNSYSKLIADFQEVKRLLPMLREKTENLKPTIDSIAQCIGERSPTFQDLESSQEKLSEIKPQIEECTKMGNKIKTVCPDYNDKDIADMDDKLNSMSILRKEKAQDIVEELVDQVLLKNYKN